jgi:hypothetical protein
MATTLDYVGFVSEQLRGMGAVRYRKMFGEYLVYVNDKPILLVCDNTVFVKTVPELDGVLIGAERGRPCEGARELCLKLLWEGETGWHDLILAMSSHEANLRAEQAKNGRLGVKVIKAMKRRKK